MKVLGARVIVKEIKLEDTSKGGIFIPGQEKTQTNRGVVISMGDGSMTEDGTKIPMVVAVGDEVIYSQFSGSPIEVDGDIFLILNERDILCVMGGDGTRVIGGRCLVKEIKLDEVSKGGIFIPGQDKLQTNKGVVVSVGEGGTLDNGHKYPISVDMGDTLIYASFAGSPIVIDGEVYMVLNERDILCVFDEEEAKTINLAR